MLIELTKATKSQAHEETKVNVNPIHIVLVRETKGREEGATRIEILNSATPDNRAYLHVTEKINEVKNKIENSQVVNFLTQAS